MLDVACIGYISFKGFEMIGKISNLLVILSWLLLTYAGRLIRAQVFELTLQNFDQYTKDKDVMLVEFFAPWCHHCQEFAPEWEKAAAALAVNREFILGRADCIGNGKELCDRFGVQMYPMVKLFRHGVFQEDFNGDRNADAVIRYLQQAQSQPGVKQENGGWTPNSDPWATGASFQYAYPMTTPAAGQNLQAAKPFEPIKAFQAKPPAPSFAAFPTPAWDKWKPAIVKSEPQQQLQQQQPSTNGNDLWNIFNSVWNRNKQPAPSPFHNGNPIKPPYIRPQPEPMQTRVASSAVEYRNFNNQPFQAQTSAFQTGMNSPPSANFIVSSNTEPGTFQGQLSALNNDEGTSFLYIDGKPYVIRRVINRFSNTFTPGQLSIGRFQPFQRFGPGFIRGAQIPHIVRQALLDSQQQKSKTVNLAGNQRSLTQSSQSFPSQQNAHLQSPQKPKASTRNSPTTPWQRFNVNKPNYMQIYANYVRSRSQSQPKQRNLHSPLSDSRSAINTLQNYYHPPYLNPAQNVLHNREQTSATPALKAAIRAGNKYAISIKGIPGSSALAAIRNKAVTNPGFLSGLLSSRSHQLNRPAQAVSELGPKRNNVMLNKLQSAKAPNNQYRVLANLPLTDRALLRTKIVRPDIWRARWANPGRPRANIAYLPRSAFNRLPSWYRPKIGPALVKYVVKAKSTPQVGFDLGNKKQSMVRPAARDVWQKIYSYYNRKNALQIKQMQDFARNKAILLARKSTSAGNIAKPVQGDYVGLQGMESRVNVGSPLIRQRDNQNLKSDKIIDESDNSEGFKLKLNTGLNTYAGGASTKGGASKSIPPEMWDKRSHVRSFLISKKNTIPHRPTIAGNWGTLKKKRSALSAGRHYRHLHNHESDV